VLVFHDLNPELQLGQPVDEAPPEAPARSCDTGLFDDIPSSIWKVFLGGWAIVFTLFALFFATDRAAAFAIVISCGFVMMAFGLPIALAAQSKRDRNPTRLIQTHSGPLTAFEAGAQIASIPVAAVIALTCFILLAK
jgi:hypothetical protein